MVSQIVNELGARFAALPDHLRLLLLVTAALVSAIALIYLFGFDGGGTTGWTGIGNALQ